VVSRVPKSVPSPAEGEASSSATWAAPYMTLISGVAAPVPWMSKVKVLSSESSLRIVMVALRVPRPGIEGHVEGRRTATGGHGRGRLGGDYELAGIGAVNENQRRASQVSGHPSRCW